jgi:uncharacterized protein YbjT (DUF2867 family)
MADKKLIAVAGATGSQGGGLVRAILAHPDGPFRVRALTRDAQSSKARALTALGAEVVAASVDDIESLKKAFDGAHGAYCVTFYWEHMSPTRETAEATNLAKAAKAAGVQHVIWSTLEDTRKWVPLSDPRMPTLMGNYKVPHFDAKGEADAVFDSLVPTTKYLASFYWENFIHFGTGPKKTPDGTYALTLPMGDKPLAGVAADDIGKTAYGIFARGAEFIGKTIGVAGEHLTGTEMATLLSKALSVPVRYNAVTPEAFRSFGFPGAEDLGNMFQFYADFSDDVGGVRSVEIARALNPELQDFRTWLNANASRIPLE